MRIVTLIENTVFNPNYVAEHGLSFYIESQNHRIIFDSGQSNLFMQNADHLGIDMKTIDYLIISHGHYDHIGGLKSFLRENSTAQIILKRKALQAKFHHERLIGLKQGLKFQERLLFVNETFTIDEEIKVVPNSTIFYPEDTNFKGFYTIQNETTIEDKFKDELFLCLDHTHSISIVSSCSHRGITNIVESASREFKKPIHTVLGGFHLRQKDDSKTESIINYMNEIRPKNIGVCHCTGIENYGLLKTRCNSNVFYNSTANEISI